MAGGEKNTDVAHASISRWRACVIFLLFAAPRITAEQEECTTVTVSGGDYPGTFELDTDSATNGVYSVEDSTLILQPLSLVGTARDARRGLLGGGGGSHSQRETSSRGGALRKGERGREVWGGRRGSSDTSLRKSRSRNLADDCETQMWILTNTSTMTNGFSYYSTFDCAEHPVDIESTWIYVNCTDCAEVVSVSVVCTADVTNTILGNDNDGDSKVFTIPVIIGITVGGVVLLCCLGLCIMWTKKGPPKGKHTFADDSEHSVGPKMIGLAAVNTSVTSATASAAAGNGIGDGNGSGNGTRSGTVPSAQGEAVRSPLDLAGTSKNAKSFKANHMVAESTLYDGIFHSHNDNSRGGSVEMEKKGSQSETRQDSMAKAAAAAGAARSRAEEAEVGLPPPPKGILQKGVVNNERAAAGGGSGGITWSAGQDLDPRQQKSYDPSDYGDSAAGSIFSGGVPDDEDLEHPYYGECDDSVAASSPGANSMYSHYTAGGRTYIGGQESETAWSSDDEGAGLAEGNTSANRRQSHVNQREIMQALPPTGGAPTAQRVPPVVKPKTRGPVRIQAHMLSPAGLMARVDNKREADGAQDAAGSAVRR